MGLGVGLGRHLYRLRQSDALSAHHRIGVFHRAMGEDRADPGIQAGSTPAAPCQRNRRPSRLARPSAALLAHQVLISARITSSAGQVKDRQAEGAFRDEGVAFDRFERGRERVGRDLVIARNDPDLTRDLDPDLRRAGDMARRVERHARIADLDLPRIGDGLQPDIAQPVADHGRRDISREIAFVARARMI